MKTELNIKMNQQIIGISETLYKCIKKIRKCIDGQTK